MPQARLRATFMRGGTSKAVVFNRTDLPADPSAWDPIFLAVMGSPDGNGRQLNGMGGGLSSVSKICVVGPPSRPDADIDYTFAQIAVKEASVDYSGNCGNMSSAMGPFAVTEGLATAPADGEAVVRIHNTNTGKVIIARFPMADGEPQTEGELAIDGVAGTGAPVRLEFIDPGGTKTGRLLPTGHARDLLSVPGLGEVEASLVDAANPCVFVAASALGKTGSELPDALEVLVLTCKELVRAGRDTVLEVADVDREDRPLVVDLLDQAAVAGATHRVRAVGHVAQRDELEGGSGRDTFVFKGGITEIEDYTAGVDRVEISKALGIDSFKELLSHARYVDGGDDVRIDFKGATLTFDDTKISDLKASDFLFI